MARLIVNDGQQVVELAAGQSVKIGRDAANEIPLPDESKASRRHCQILGVNSAGVTRYEVTDLGSTNKTRVGGKVVERKVLSHGDVIEIGAAQIRFEDENEERMLRDAGSQGVCYLEWVSKERKGEKVWLRGPRTTLGRRESSTIVLDDRMASGHHAEIVKDLNGYTLRDMGSTNGTLVNGEPASEVALSHGSRVRIGNSRFVFKDPSMKDIEVELAQFDDDDGWGMLGDVDLSRAKGGYAGLLVGLVLLGAAAAGAWFFVQGEQQGEQVGSAADSNLIADGTFQDESPAWASAVEGAPIRVSGGGGKPLVVRYEGDGAADAADTARATYAERFAGLASRPYKLEAKVRSSGPADLLAVWSNAVGAGSRVAAIARAIPLVVEGGRASATLVKPSWAENLSLAVRVGPEGRLTLESIRLEESTAGEGSQLVRVKDVPGTVEAWVTPTDGSLDLVEGLAQRFVGARPIARQADGTLLSRFVVEGVAAEGGAVVATGRLRAPGAEDAGVATTIRWSAGGEDGLQATVTVDGATAGLAVELPRDHLGDGVRLLTERGPQTISARAGSAVDGARKVLSGSAEDGGAGLVTWSPAGEQAAIARVELADALDASLLEMWMFGEGATASFHTVTDYGPSRRIAEQRLSAARLRLSEQPVAAIADLRGIAQEFPFNEGVREEALRLAASRERQLADQVDEAAAALRAHEIFGSADTLQTATAKVGDAARLLGLEGQDAPPVGSGPVVTRAHELVVALAEARAAQVARAAGAEVARLERLATMLQGVDGYEPMAALYLRILVDRFGDTTSDPALEARLEQARTRLDALRTQYTTSLLPDPATSGR
ncbi:MAG: FHA domain-containing protein [Planctomycetota bacterium]